MMPELIYMQEAFGVDGKVHSLMSGFFTQTRVAINVPLLLPCFVDMSLRRSVSMVTESAL